MMNLHPTPMPEALDTIIDALRTMREPVQALGESTIEDEYPRAVLPHEIAAEVRAEAEAHGCIIATKGEVICIVPTLPKGWTQVSGIWRQG